MPSKSARLRIDYSGVTELPGSRAWREQLSRLYHRYRTAAQYCEGKAVLEVGCGAGQGLGYLARRAKLIVGGDCTATNLRCAREYYKERLNLVGLDAHYLPFPEGSFDVVILFEAIYYLALPEKFLEESRRVLRKGGLLLICTVNRDWADFSPSPFSVEYFSAHELAAMLREKRFETELFGAFPVSTGSKWDKLVSVIKRTAVALDLIPRTMKGREFLKRIFFGELSPIPTEVEEGMAEYTLPTRIPCGTRDFEHKVIYTVGRVR